MSVVSTHKEPVGRRLRKGVDIVAGNQIILLNSKEEFLQGAVPSIGTDCVDTQEYLTKEIYLMGVLCTKTSNQQFKVR